MMSGTADSDKRWDCLTRGRKHAEFYDKEKETMSEKIKENDPGTTGEQRALRVALFISRNKDNSDVPGFEQRSRKFLTDKTDDELRERFEEFVYAGVPGEFCRLYVSVNARDNEKVQRGLMHWLVDHPDQDMAHIESRTVAIAAKSECAAERKWMFDFDTDVSLLPEFEADVAACDPNVELEAFATPNGLCVITSRGFDVRKLDLGGKWRDVELKKDDQRCLYWKRRE